MAKTSKKQLPGITFEKGEHLVLVIKRTKLIPLGFWAGAFICSIVLIAASILINGGSSFVFNLDPTSRSFFLMIILVVLGTIWIATLISTHVYSGNCLYVTNKRLIQNIVTSLFSSSTNVIDLVAVEDVSFKQSGIFEHMFSVGTLRMSTIGSETTYTFEHVDTPTDELETITHLVHVEKGEAPAESCTVNGAANAASTVINSSAPTTVVATQPVTFASTSDTVPPVIEVVAPATPPVEGVDTSSTTFNPPVN